jgi:nitroreductase
MDLKQIVEIRRATRSLAPVTVTEELIRDLADCAKMAPSCYNHQPWRFIFVHKTETLETLFTAMSRGNEWTQQASMIIAVFSEKSLDCQVKGREYYLFDTGMAVAFLLLRATEMGLVAHPIAGFDEDKVKQILRIPDKMTLITLIIVGKKTEQISPLLSEKMARVEKERPPRNEFPQFASINSLESGGA